MHYQRKHRLNPARKGKVGFAIDPVEGMEQAYLVLLEVLLFKNANVPQL